MSEQQKAELVIDGLMTLREVQDFTRLSRTDLYTRMTRGELPFVKLGKRRLVPRRAVVDLAAAGLVGV
jgi:excisionase family DNA binding protein